MWYIFIYIEHDDEDVMFFLLLIEMGSGKKQQQQRQCFNQYLEIIVIEIYSKNKKKTPIVLNRTINGISVEKKMVTL